MASWILHAASRGGHVAAAAAAAHYSCVLKPPEPPSADHQLHCDCGELNQPLTEPLCQEMEAPSLGASCFLFPVSCKLEESPEYCSLWQPSVLVKELCNQHHLFLGGQKSVRTKTSQTVECVRVWPLTSKCAAQLLRRSSWVCGRRSSSCKYTKLFSWLGSRCWRCFCWC